MSGPSYERLLQPRPPFRLQRQGFTRLPQGQQTMRRKNGREHCRIHSLNVFPALKGGDFHCRRATFRPRHEECLERH